MYDGLPDRHQRTTDGFLDGWHCCGTRAQQPPDHGRDGGADRHGNRTTDGRHVERAGFMRILDVPKRETFDLVQHERQQSRSRADRDANDGHRRDQRRDAADVRPWFRLVLRLLRHPCLSHVACTSSSVHLVIRVAASPSFHPRRIYAPISFSMNRSIGHTTCVCIVNGRSGSSSSATRPATSAKHHKAYSGRFIGGKYIGIYSIQDTRCTK